MGVADLVQAFNSASQPQFTCAKAFLGYEHHDTAEWQVLTFRGTSAEGVAFECKSDRLNPGVDVNVAAREVAVKFVADRQPKEPIP